MDQCVRKNGEKFSDTDYYEFEGKYLIDQHSHNQVLWAAIMFFNSEV